MKNRFYQLFLAVCLIGFISCNTEQNTNATAEVEETTKQEAVAENNRAIAPPLIGIDVPYEQFQVASNEAKTIELNSGTTLNIPANAFVYEDGTPVTEAVEISFREFHSAPEIIVSGIPMSVETENGKEWMQTAGMFEIQGKVASGKTVQINDEKEVTIDLHSEVEGDYDYWALNPETNNWEDIGDSQSTRVQDSNATANNAGNARAAAQKKPVAPAKFDPKLSVIDMEIDMSDFPELASKKGIMWQYAGNNPSEDPSRNADMQKEAFESIALTKNASGKYIAVFEGEENTYNIPVKMVQRGADYEAAFAAYQQEMKSYRAARAQMEATRQQQVTILRTLNIPSFGFFNCDIFYRMKEPVRMMASFDFGENDLPELLKDEILVYHITGSRRAILTYNNFNKDRFFFEPGSDNCLFAVLPGNKIATFSNADFEEQMADLKGMEEKETYHFKMKVADKPVESLGDVSSALLL